MVDHMFWLAPLLAVALQGDADFESARNLYRELQYEQAILVFERLSVRFDFTPSEKAEILLWMALCYEGIGDSASSERAMREALTRDLNVQLPVKTSPRIAERLETLRKDVVPAEQPPPPPPPPPPPKAEEPIPIVPIAIMSGGAVAVLGGSVLGIVAAERYATSQDQERFADERAQSHGAYVGSLIGALALGVVGAGALGTGGVLFMSGD
jgi:hypothetical protein